VTVRRTAFFAALLAALAGFTHATTVEQPRALGHRIGDVLTQRVLLRHDDGRHATPLALPPADRVGAWFERRAARIEGPDADGRRWLRLDYQVINSPREIIDAALPALSISTDGGVLAVPAHAVSLGPIAPPRATALRPDRPVVAEAAAPLEQRLRTALLLFGATLLAWLGWWRWREHRDGTRLPFAQAWRELRRRDVDAWRTLHRAIDASAGHVVRGATLERLFAEQPPLRALQPQLEAFYRASDARFFDDRGSAEAVDLRALARALRDAERQHAR
jgi:mxaA protein